MKWLAVMFIVPALASVEGPHNITGSPCLDSNHIFLAPGVLTAGGTSRTCVSRFYTEGPANVILTLVTEGQNVTASRDLGPGDGGCIDISVPQLPNTKAELYVNIRYPEARCTWDHHLTLRIASGRVVVIHTERTRYRPNDVIRIRAIALKADLTPSPGHIEEIWLEGPRDVWDGVKMAHWTRVRTRMGIAQVQHDLDDTPPPGKWVARARLSDGSEGATAFHVGNYELPPFQLTVRHSPRVLRTSERLVWTVCVRYPWSEAVEGMLVIRLRGAGVSSSSMGPSGSMGSAGFMGSHESTGIRTAVRLKARACHRHAAAAKRIGLNGDLAPDVVVADFAFQEEGTRVWQNTTVVSQVVDHPVTIEFLARHLAVVSPELPYKIKVKATRWDDKPASNETIRVCRYKAPSSNSSSHSISLDLFSNQSSNSSKDGVCVEGVTDEKGVARVMFSADGDKSPFYEFKASLRKVSASTRAYNSGSLCALGALRAAPRALLPLYVAAPVAAVAAVAAVTAHFVVITRGGTIYRWGATTQCLTTNDRPHVEERGAVCPSDLVGHEASGGQEGDVLQMELSGMSRILLPIKITQQMCPDSHIVAYFKYGDEIITASKHFMVDECFVNKPRRGSSGWQSMASISHAARVYMPTVDAYHQVEAQWSSRQTAPGAAAVLRVQAAGPALCALSARQATTPPPSTTTPPAAAMLHALDVLLQTHRNLTEYDAAGNCFLTSDNPELPTTGTELMSFWLASAGVRVAPATEHKRCMTPNFLLANDALVPRSDFSEAWLWRVVPVPAAGGGAVGEVAVAARAPDTVTRYEATAVCVSRAGVGVSPPAVLQVFREVFIHASGPRRLRRGDVGLVPYRLFNYLYQPLSVQVRTSTQAQAENICIPARASITRRMEVVTTTTTSTVTPMKLRISVTSIFDGSCSKENRSVSDEVLIEIKVDPEGFPVQEHKSAVICASDNTKLPAPSVSWSWSVSDGDAALWLTGDLLGPLLYDADSLVQLPRGCGEQSMARLATNMLAASLLPPRAVARLAALRHVERGVARQLQYSHSGGGCSAWGGADLAPSLWLSAFCVRYLRRAHRMLSSSPPPPWITSTERWLQQQQMENGCFRNGGHVFHTQLKGGLNEDGDISSVALSAYVITSLLQTPVPTKIILNSLSCLRAFPQKSKKVYATALVTYAYVKLKEFETEKKLSFLTEGEVENILMGFLQMATSRDGFTWWDTGNLATSIEATGYALQTLSACEESLRSHCAESAWGAVRWLSAQRDAAGGFLSTQDTLIALEGLSQWRGPPATGAVTLHWRQRSLTLHLSPNNNTHTIASLSKHNISASDQLNISIHGGGCALVRMSRTHYAQQSRLRDALGVRLRLSSRGPFACDAGFCFCAAVLQTCVWWRSSLPEMSLLEVTLPSGYTLDAASLYAQLQDTDTLLRRIEVSSNNGKANLYLGTRDGSDTTARAGHACYNVHAVGPRTKTKPAYVKIIDYYRPYVEDVQMYTIPEDCPSEIAEEVNEYNATDNLFNKARSLTESGEILISYEYPIDDIPDGIPLEDPLYDNLTKRDDNENKGNNDKIDTYDCYNNKTNQVKVTDENGVLLNNEIVPEGLYNDRNENNEVILNISEQMKTDKNISNDTINKLKLNSFDNDIKNDSENEINSFANKDKNKHKIHIRDESKEINVAVNTNDNNYEEREVNPTLSAFHVIDTDRDLEVPSGIEGPVPAVMLPPENFVVPTDIEIPQHSQSWRSHPYQYRPVYYKENYFSKNRHIPVL